MTRQPTQTPQPGGQDSLRPQSQVPSGQPSPDQPLGQTPLSLAPSEFDYEASPSVNGDGVEAALLAADHAHESQREIDPFRTTIKLEFGEGLKEHYWVYLGPLQRCSKVVTELFTEAESLRKVYEEAKAIKAHLKSVIMPEVAAEAFSDDDTIEAVRLVRSCLTQYPQEEYQPIIRKYLKQYAETNVFPDAKKMKMPQTKGGVKNKAPVDLPLTERLNQFTAIGVRSLALELYRVLRKIHLTERGNARQDKLKAAAQGRILLQGADRRTVFSILFWLTNHELRYEDAAHLCKIHSLCERLEIRELSKACMDTLSNAMHSALVSAEVAGNSLRGLLEKSHVSEPSAVVNAHFNDIVPTVFDYVLGEANAPIVLRDLVIQALAANDADLKAFELIEKRVDKTLLAFLYKRTARERNFLKANYISIKPEGEPM